MVYNDLIDINLLGRFWDKAKQHMPSGSLSLVGRASGSMANFTDNFGGEPLKSLIVNIEPAQAGSGDPSPSNIRALSGFTGCNLRQSGSDTTDYETVTFSFGATVYGGKLNVLTGELIATHAYRELDGVTTGYKFTAKSSSTDRNEYYTSATAAISDYGRSAGEFTTRYVPNEALAKHGYWCSAAPVMFDVADAYVARIYVGDNGPQLRLSFLKSSEIQTLAQANQWLADLYAAGTPYAVVHELAQPVVYHLTAQEVVTLLGENNIWADCGDVSLEYWQNPDLRDDIQEMIDAAIYGAIGGSY